MDTIIDIAKEVTDNSFTGFEKIPKRTLDKIREHGEDKLLAFMFLGSPESFMHVFLLVNSELWKAFTVDSWRNLIIAIQDSQIGLYSLLSFLSKYLKIDSIDIYKNIPNLNEEIRVKVLDYFIKRPGLLRLHDHERKFLKEKNIFVE